jgi:hypothetical protein
MISEWIKFLLEATRVTQAWGSLVVEAAWEELPDRDILKAKLDKVHQVVKQIIRELANTRHSEISNSTQALKLKARGWKYQTQFYVKQGIEDLASTRQTLEHSPQVQGVFNSVADLSGALFVHETAGFVLDFCGLSLLADLARMRGRLGFGIRGFLLLKLVPPYFSKAEKQEKIEQEASHEGVLIDPETRVMPGVEDREFRDFLNLNCLHVLGLLVWAYGMGKLAEIYGSGSQAAGLKFFSHAYVQGHFLWQYPLARDQWGSASIIHRLASRPGMILGAGIIFEGVNQLLLASLPAFMAMPLSLLWALSLILLSYHCRGPFTVNLKEHPLTPAFYDPGLRVWGCVNGMIDVVAWIFRPKHPALSPAKLWGGRVGELLTLLGLRKLKFEAVEGAIQGPYGRTLQKMLGFSDVASLVTRHTAFMVNDYGEAFAHCRDVVMMHHSKIEISQRLLQSSVFNYLGRPLLLFAYGPEGVVAKILWASDFVLAAFPNLTPDQVERMFGKVSGHLDAPVIVRHVPSRTVSLDEDAYGVPAARGSVLHSDSKADSDGESGAEEEFVLAGEGLPLAPGLIAETPIGSLVLGNNSRVIRRGGEGLDLSAVDAAAFGVPG